MALPAIFCTIGRFYPHPFESVALITIPKQSFGRKNSNNISSENQIQRAELRFHHPDIYQIFINLRWVQFTILRYRIKSSHWKTRFRSKTQFFRNVWKFGISLNVCGFYYLGYFCLGFCLNNKLTQPFSDASWRYFSDDILHRKPFRFPNHCLWAPQTKKKRL